ncbi:unnamed protein product [Rotaria socialis]
MASAVHKPDNTKEIAEYMEYLSKEYFSKIFPNSIISIENKPKTGKQGGHIVMIRSSEANSTDTTIKKFYVKPQDQFVIPSTSSLSLTSKLADVEELFIYKLLSNINKAPSAHFYINQNKPDCLLIATADGNSVSYEKFFTAACYPTAHIEAYFTVEDIILIRVLEVRLCLQDVSSNTDNYGWLNPSKKMFIIDFSINENVTMKSKPPLAANMLTDKIHEHGHILICKLISKFNQAERNMKVAFAYRAVESVIDSFADAISTNS